MNNGFNLRNNISFLKLTNYNYLLKTEAENYIQMSYGNKNNKPIQMSSDNKNKNLFFKINIQIAPFFS